MCPRIVEKSRLHSSSLEGVAKLWLVLVGVNRYQDDNLPSLQYSALDCQGLGEALECRRPNHQHSSQRMMRDGNVGA